MKTNKLVIIVSVFAMVFTMAGAARADLSQAAVPFLTIAPGARAGAMGESFVAIADDATASHWNPAGLGAPPLSSSWLSHEVPVGMRPLSQVALTHSGGSGYRAYDVWAISAKGLVRFDFKDWYLGEEFTTKRSEKLRNIVRSFFGTNDAERLNEMVRQTAEFNSDMTFEELQNLRETIMKKIPEEYSAYDQMVAWWDSLETAYDQCRIKWNRVSEISKLEKEGLKDGDLSEQEIDRISFAVEKAHSRYIVETIFVPYSAAIPGELTTVTSIQNSLVVGSDNGLAMFNGRQWRLYTTEDGLPSPNITVLSTTGNDVLVGTDSGLVQLSAFQISPYRPESNPPTGKVTAIGSNGPDVWAVADNELYHYDGRAWTTTTTYTVAIDETAESLGRRFSIYGSPAEVENFVTEFETLNQAEEQAGAMADTTEAAGSENIEDEQAQPEATGDAQAETPEEAKSEGSADGVLAAGETVMVPYVAELKGEVQDIYVEPTGTIWLGTSYGIARFDGDGWRLFGYGTYTAKGGETIIDVVEEIGRTGTRSIQESVDLLVDINDLESETLSEGQTIKVFRNPASASTRSINGRGGRVYFATSDGMLQFNGRSWGRADKEGMGRDETIAVESPDHGLWFVSSRKLAVLNNGNQELSLMHVKWLPGLTDDVYYEFFGYAHPVEGWGTLGGNVTFITYGSSEGRDAEGNPTGSFTSFEIAFTGSYGTPLTSNLSGGVSAKVIWSHLSPRGVGQERGDGVSWGFAVDLGILYRMSSRLNLGMAILNIGPDIAYSDVNPQSDPLPRTLSVGFAYLLKDSDPFRITLTGQANKTLISVNDGLSNEIGEVLSSIGGELSYARTIAFRLGYKHDGEDPSNSIMTLGAGLKLFDWLELDVSYIPSNSASDTQENTLRYSPNISF